MGRDLDVVGELVGGRVDGKTMGGFAGLLLAKLAQATRVFILQTGLERDPAGCCPVRIQHLTGGCALSKSAPPKHRTANLGRYGLRVRVQVRVHSN